MKDLKQKAREGKNQAEVVEAFTSRLNECHKLLTCLMMAGTTMPQVPNPHISQYIYEAERSLREARMKDEIERLHKEVKELNMKIGAYST